MIIDVIGSLVVKAVRMISALLEVVLDSISRRQVPFLF